MGYTILLYMGGMPIQQTLTASPQHLTLDELKPLLQLSAIDEVFALVRNPYHRLLSEYRWVTRSISNPELVPPLDSWITEQISRAKTDPHHADNHIRPMIDFLDPDIPCRIFTYESGLCAVTEFYCEEDIIQPPPMAERNRTSAVSSSRDHANTLPNAIEQLPAGTLELVNDYYQEDFFAFSYPIANPRSNIQTPAHCAFKQVPALKTSVRKAANYLASSDQDCISALAAKLLALRSTLKAIREQDLRHFSTQTKMIQSDVISLTTERDQLAAEAQELRGQCDQLSAEAQELRDQRDQLSAEVRREIEKLADACKKSSQTSQRLRTTLEELENYYMLLKVYRCNFQRALSLLNRFSQNLSPCPGQSQDRAWKRKA